MQLRNKNRAFGLIRKEFGDLLRLACIRCLGRRRGNRNSSGKTSPRQAKQESHGRQVEIRLRMSAITSPAWPAMGCA